MKGWGPKSSVCPSKPRETKLFGGISRDFAGTSWGHPKSLRKKSLCSMLVPYLGVGDKRAPFERALYFRKPQIFADSPFSWKFQHLEGAGNRRKPQIFAENRRFSQDFRRLDSVTLGPSPLARPSLESLVCSRLPTPIHLATKNSRGVGEAGMGGRG